MSRARRQSAASFATVMPRSDGCDAAPQADSQRAIVAAGTSLSRSRSRSVGHAARSATTRAGRRSICASLTFISARALATSDGSGNDARSSASMRRGSCRDATLAGPMSCARNHSYSASIATVATPTHAPCAAGSPATVSRSISQTCDI